MPDDAREHLDSITGHARRQISRGGVGAELARPRRSRRGAERQRAGGSSRATPRGRRARRRALRPLGPRRRRRRRSPLHEAAEPIRALSCSPTVAPRLATRPLRMRAAVAAMARATRWRMRATRASSSRRHCVAQLRRKLEHDALVDAGSESTCTSPPASARRRSTTASTSTSGAEAPAVTPTQRDALEPGGLDLVGGLHQVRAARRPCARARPGGCCSTTRARPPRAPARPRASISFTAFWRFCVA